MDIAYTDRPGFTVHHTYKVATRIIRLSGEATRGDTQPHHPAIQLEYTTISTIVEATVNQYRLKKTNKQV